MRLPPSLTSLYLYFPQSTDEEAFVVCLRSYEYLQALEAAATTSTRPAVVPCETPKSATPADQTVQADQPGQGVGGPNSNPTPTPKPTAQNIRQSDGGAPSNNSKSNPNPPPFPSHTLSTPSTQTPPRRSAERSDPPMELPGRESTRRLAGQTGQAAQSGLSNPNPPPQPDLNFPSDSFSADPKKTTPTPPAKHTPNSGTHKKHSAAKKIRQEKQREELEQLREELRKQEELMELRETRKRKGELGAEKQKTQKRKK